LIEQALADPALLSWRPGRFLSSQDTGRHRPKHGHPSGGERSAHVFGVRSLAGDSRQLGAALVSSITV